jgi:thymidylate synthase (FAD)
VTEEQLHRIGKQTFESGHHTVFLHKMISFDLIASRHVFHLLHYHPFYNSSQSSQRYVVLRKPEVIIPPEITGNARNIFESMIKELWSVYNELIENLSPIIKNNYPGKRKLDDKAAEKLAIETARYVLPIGAKSTAIHSIGLMTLLRLYRIAGGGAWGWELQELLQQAVNIIKREEPDMSRYIPVPLLPQESPEQRYINFAAEELLTANEKRRLKEREILGPYSTKLIDWNEKFLESLTRSTMLVSGGYESAFQSILNPIENKHLIDQLHIDWQVPNSRILTQGWVSFFKRLSHTCNAQDQRHRTINSVTTLPELSETWKPDYITPELIKFDPYINSLYEKALEELYATKAELVRNYGISVSSALYLTPNAHAIYVQQSGTLLAFRHKWILRSCWRAQREIWGLTMEEIAQVTAKWPELKPYLGPPCYIRYLPDLKSDNMTGPQKKDWIKPKCTEGRMYCDVPVIWKKFTPTMERLI